MMKLAILTVALFIGYLYGQTANDSCIRACILINRPVCGSDNKTYVNECTMGYAACSQNKTITVQAEGVCKPEPEELQTEAPVEEPDGKPEENPEEETAEEEAEEEKESQEEDSESE